MESDRFVCCTVVCVRSLRLIILTVCDRCLPDPSARTPDSDFSKLRDFVIGVVISIAAL